MTSPINTEFVSGTTITSQWLNGVNDHVNDKEPSAHTSDNIAYLPARAGAVPTDVQSKLRESVSVKDFGAVGDGIVDDTVAIQTAFDESAGKTVYVPKGTYNISDTLQITTQLTVVGDTQGQSVIQKTTADTALKLFSPNVKLIRLKVNGGVVS